MNAICVCGDMYGELLDERSISQFASAIIEKFVLRNSNSFFKTNLYLQISRDAGIKTAALETVTNVPSMLYKREIGQFQYGGFSKPIKRKMHNYYLPNKYETVQNYPESEVYHIRFSHDGQQLIVVTLSDNKIRFYDTEYKLIKEVPFKIDAHHRPYTDRLQFGLSKQWFAYTDSLGTVHMVPIAKNATEEICVNPVDIRNLDLLRPCIDFSGDGNEILGSTIFGEIYVYDLNTNQLACRIPTNMNWIKMATFSDYSSNVLFSISYNNFLIKIWDRRLPSPYAVPEGVGVLKGHRGQILCLKSKGDGVHLVSHSEDNSVKLWDIRNCMSFSDDIPADTDNSLTTFFGHKSSSRVPHIDFSPLESTGQRYVYTTCYHGNVIIYDILTGQFQCKKSPLGRNLQANIAWHPLKNEILVSDYPDNLGRWIYCNEEI